MIKAILLTSLLIFTGCKYKTYTIEKGKHYAKGLNFAVTTQKELPLMARFDSSAIYQTKDPRNQGDINKLIGFSDCLEHHHKNSARLGWRWLNDELQILAYTYKNGERIRKEIKSIPLNTKVPMSIKVEGTQYRFQVEDEVVYMDRGCNGRVKGYLLYPYFGGDETAPHKIEIDILKPRNKFRMSKRDYRKLKKIFSNQ
jgi:hypothetical protein